MSGVWASSRTPGEGGTMGATEWVCEAWRNPAGCPQPRPLIGSPCAIENQECHYGDFCCAPVFLANPMRCEQGRWGNAGGGCSGCSLPRCGAP
jgi:hypothetical protein